MLTPVTHIIPLATIRRERLLPISGRVLVRSGQKVKPMDTVVEGNLVPEHLILQVARGLGVTPEEADQLIERRAGEEVVEGDVIASRGGLARRVIRSPASGRIVMVGEGLVFLEVERQPHQVLAGIPGKVVQVVPDRGAVIETTGALVQGVWGNGRLDYGLIQVVMEAPDSVLAPEQLDVRMRGSIVLAGHCDREEALEAAVDMSLRGLILSSMTSRLVLMASQLRFPVMVIEGFGRRPMESGTYQLLSTNENREVILNAQRFDRLVGKRPEIIIPLPTTGLPSVPHDAMPLAPGQKVRVTRAPHTGEVGTLSALQPGMAEFPSGVRAPAAKVTLVGGQTVMVPVANLEILA